MTTTTTDERQRATLTDEQLARVVELCGEPGDGWVRAIVAVFEVFGFDLSDPDGPRVDGRRCAIPVGQWRTVGAAMAGGTGNAVGRVSHLLDWMNWGPSSFEVEAVTT